MAQIGYAGGLSIPFLKINAPVEKNFPLGYDHSMDHGQLVALTNITDQGLREITSTRSSVGGILGSGGVVDYGRVRFESSPSIDAINGSGLNTTTKGWTMFIDGKEALTAVDITTVGYEYTHANFGYSQYLRVFVVDNNKHIGFILLDYNPDDPGATSIAGDAVMVPAAGVDFSAIYEALKDEEWEFIDIDKREGGTGFMSRYSPRVKSNTIGIYPVTEQQMHDFGKDMWDTTWEEFIASKVLGHPMDSLLGVKWYYGLKDDIMRSTSAVHLTMGKTVVGSVTTKPALSEYVEHKCGSVIIPAKYNSYLDMSPYTKVQIYIPYVGYSQLSANDVVGGSLSLIYRVNIVTGQAIAMLYANNPRVKNQCIAVLPANLSCDIPFNATRSSVMESAFATFGAAVKIGLSGGMAAGMAVNDMMQSFDRVASADSDSAKASAESLRAEDKASSSLQSTKVSMVEQGANAIHMVAPDVSRGGGLNADGGNLGFLTPFVIVERPVTLKPAKYIDMVGNPSSVTKRLGNCKGFTQVCAVVDTSSITSKYQSEILGLLRAGVYL